MVGFVDYDRVLLLVANSYRNIHALDILLCELARVKKLTQLGECARYYMRLPVADGGQSALVMDMVVSD